MQWGAWHVDTDQPQCFRTTGLEHVITVDSKDDCKTQHQQRPAMCLSKCPSNTNTSQKPLRKLNVDGVANTCQYPLCWCVVSSGCHTCMGAISKDV